MSGRLAYDQTMFGDEMGTVTALRAFPLHGIEMWDVAVTFDDGRVEETRLGPEGVPAGLVVGDRVLVRKAAMMIVGLQRPAE